MKDIPALKSKKITSLISVMHEEEENRNFVKALKEKEKGLI
jgi:hypothetical protein